MTLVVDSSVILAALLQGGASSGRWAENVVTSDALAAPHHLHAEVAGVLRRRTLAGEISDEVASTAYAALLAMTFELHPYEPFALRVWELRHTVTVKDAWFIALAEWLEAPLATLDMRLTRAPGPRCQFVTPGA